MNIFLIGFMASGKTTIGKILSKKLQMEFKDIDVEIEKRNGISSAKINATQGETAFREIERTELLELIKYNNQIISTGGGTPCYYDNMEIMNRTGVTVYLKMETEALLERLHKLSPASIARRLMIAEKSEEEIFRFVTSNMEKRKEYYEMAKCIVSNESHDACVAVERILASLQNFK